MKIIETKSFKIASNISGDPSASRLALLLPGRLDTKDYANFVSHSEYLEKLGYLVVAIDPPGTWESPGNLEDYTTSLYIQTVNELIEFFGNRPTLLLGHSRGGATSILSSGNPAVCALVLVNSAYGNPSPPDLEILENGKLPEFRDIPPGNVRTKEQIRYDMSMKYFEDGPKHNPIQALNSFKGPKLIIHASEDEFKTIEKVKEIYENASKPKSFLEINCKHDYRLYPEVIELVESTLGKFIEENNLH